MAILKSGHWDSLYRHGYTVIRGGVAQQATLSAATIEVAQIPDGDPAWKKQNDTWREITPCTKPAVLKLLNETVEPVSGELFGRAIPPFADFQLAEVRPGHTGQYLPHIDGRGPDGKFHPFSALLGIALQDSSGSFEGNAMVWPGSHWDYQAQFKNCPLWKTDWLAEKNKLAFGSHIGSSPKSLILKEGDVMISHMFVYHGVSRYDLPTDPAAQKQQPRKMAYLRLQSPHLWPGIQKDDGSGNFTKTFDEAMMHDIWAHFAPPLKYR